MSMAATALPITAFLLFERFFHIYNGRLDRIAYLLHRMIRDDLLREFAEGILLFHQYAGRRKFLSRHDCFTFSRYS